MSFWEAFLLGLVQGLTEFLPVSSSAHLVFVQHLLGFTEPLLFFDVILHVGTLVGLVVYFARDLAYLLRDSVYGISYLFRRKPMQDISEIAPYSRWALGIFVASVPTALIGLVFEDWFEQLFGLLHNVGYELFATSAVLWLTRTFQSEKRGIDRARYLDFLIIGTCQGISIAPGISRSAVTIAAALFLGLKREDAFRFSFLLAIPAIVGAGLLELREGLAGWMWGWQPLAIGFVVSGFLGYLSLHFLSRVMRRGKLHLFGIYTFLLGALILYLAGGFE